MIETKEICTSCGEERRVFNPGTHVQLYIGKVTFTPESAAYFNPKCGDCREWKNQMAAKYGGEA